MIKLSPKQIDEIAQSLDAGFKCYYNTKTSELKEVIDFDMHPHAEGEFWEKELDEIEKNFDDYVIFEPMESFESFRVMERFIDEIDDPEFQNRLIRALSRKSPFKNFKYEIDYNGEYREKWFAFKLDKFKEYIADVIELFNAEEAEDGK